MRLMTCFAMLFISCFSFVVPGSSFAAKIYYRHIPFNLSINSDDTIIVNYDFSEKNGIRCSTNNDKISVDFTYKGKHKTAHVVPIILESAHVPKHEHEELADIEGQFSLTVDKNQLSNEHQVSCSYAE